ncbi:hypothetical protein H2204_001511 [Knufia peltigerae]|uniref:Uncharacterized protein n=1 Tax=Knufia peltigerae TaxID=1002370 RepID=A0AA39D292_9EURO|nr:hypothetical protein H2204_001511 [Knufia peltigerae]
MSENMNQPSPFRIYAFFAPPRSDHRALPATDDLYDDIDDRPQTINPYEMHLTPPAVSSDDILHSVPSIAQRPPVQANGINTQTVFLHHPPIYYQNIIAPPWMPDVQYFPQGFMQQQILNEALVGTHAGIVPTLGHLMPLQPPALPMHATPNYLPPRMLLPRPPAQLLQGLGQGLGQFQYTGMACHRFDTLPPEVRLKIYGYLFDGAIIEVIPRNMMNVGCQPEAWFSPYKLIENAHTDIIRTSKFFLREAVPSLARATTLKIWQAHHPEEANQDPLRHFPESFLDEVETITVEFNTFVHIDRSWLPKLKQVNLFHDVDSPGGFVDTVHVINCQNCGGANAVVDEAFDGAVHSWRWFQRQFAYLGRREGFTVDMTVTWEVYCEAPGMAKFVFKMDCARNAVVRTQAFIGSQEVGTNSEAQAAQDWIAYSGI